MHVTTCLISTGMTIVESKAMPLDQTIRCNYKYAGFRWYWECTGCVFPRITNIQKCEKPFKSVRTTQVRFKSPGGLFKEAPHCHSWKLKVGIWKQWNTHVISLSFSLSLCLLYLNSDALLHTFGISSVRLCLQIFAYFFYNFGTWLDDFVSQFDVRKFTVMLIGNKLAQNIWLC